MSNPNVHQSIEELVAEEHTLFEKGDAMTADERRRINEINVQLDRLWDLLRQRRAKAEFGQNPGDAQVRPPSVVETYLQ